MGDPLKDWRRPTTRTRTSPGHFALGEFKWAAGPRDPIARPAWCDADRGRCAVLDKAEDLLHLEQAMKDDIGALSGTIAGEVALSAYRRTVHIRQNSDRILSSMRPLARVRAIPDGKCARCGRRALAVGGGGPGTGRAGGRRRHAPDLHPMSAPAGRARAVGDRRPASEASSVARRAGSDRARLRAEIALTHG